jgi:general secretion pathway protein B
MSFILDALKKSEIERQRQTTPGLIETAVAPRRSRIAVWLIVLGGLLAINFAVLLFVLIRASGTAAVAPIPAPASAPASAPAPAPPPAPGAADHFSPMDAPVYAPEIPVEQSATASKPAPAPRAAPEPPPAATAAADEDAKAENAEVLPLISEVDLGSVGIPELHLDVHVFATKPSDRFVYINMRKYHEGATLQEGPVIERIRRDGVVLSYHGVRFLLPRAVSQ